MSLSEEKTKITPLCEDFDFLGQTVRKHKRRNGKAGKLQITPSKASFQAIKTKIKTLCKRHKGVTPEELINKLNPVLSGWANYHRHVICGETFNQVDNFVWGRVYRWCKRRHPDKTGRWVANRYFLSNNRKGWRFTDPQHRHKPD